jgi:hypothetical protein
MPFLVTNLQFVKLAASIKSGIVCDGLYFVLGLKIQSKQNSREFCRGKSVKGLNQFIYNQVFLSVLLPGWMCRKRG